MRLAFLGTSDFAVPVLEKLLQSNHVVAGVVTGPDKPAGRGRKMLPTPVKKYALSYDLPILTPEKLKNPAFLEEYTSWNIDAAVVVAFRILPEVVFDLPRYGTLNVHPSLLPRYRGPAPLNWALINGDKETAVSIIKISKKVDAGGVILQRQTEIESCETACELGKRLAPLGGEMILEALEGLKNQNLHPIPQDENLVTRAPKLTKEDGLINWKQEAIQVHNQVRGVTPWPGAYSFFQGCQVKLFASRPVDMQGEPGEILLAKNELVIACSSGAVAFGELQREGKKCMSVEACLRGTRMETGTKFSDSREG